MAHFKQLLKLAAAVTFIVGGAVSQAALAEEFGGIAGVNISWSPDGKKLAFYSNHDGDYEIYLIDIDGTNIRQLTNNDVYDAMPAFAPDGNGIVYASRDEASWNIYYFDVDGVSPVLLIGRAGYNDTWPNMATDGSIIFSASAKEPAVEGDSDIHIWHPDTGEITALIDSDFRDNQGRLSQSGDMLAFSSNRSGRLEVYVAGPDGSNIRQISQSPAEQDRFGSAFPVFAPDGGFLVFWGDDNGGFLHDHHHYVHDFTTGETRVLTKRILSTAYPALSPDGQWIAYVAAETGDEQSEFYIYIMDTNGENHRRIWPEE